MKSNHNTNISQSNILHKHYFAFYQACQCEVRNVSFPLNPKPFFPVTAGDTLMAGRILESLPAADEIPARGINTRERYLMPWSPLRCHPNHRVLRIRKERRHNKIQNTSWGRDWTPVFTFFFSWASGGWWASHLNWRCSSRRWHSCEKAHYLQLNTACVNHSRWHAEKTTRSSA